MAASDYVPIFFKNRLHLAGRPQMSTRSRHRSHSAGDSRHALRSAERRPGTECVELFQDDERRITKTKPLTKTKPHRSYATSFALPRLVDWLGRGTRRHRHSLVVAI